MREALRSLRHVALKREGRRGGRFCSCSEEGEEELSESMMPPRMAMPMVPVREVSVKWYLLLLLDSPHPTTVRVRPLSEAIVKL
jgi:hypothetical protein